MRAVAAIVSNICTDGNSAATAFGKCGSQEQRSFSRLFRIHRLAEGQLRASSRLYLPKTDVFLTFKTYDFHLCNNLIIMK